MIEKIAEIIVEYIGDESINVNRNTVLIADLGLNSLDLINLVYTVENEFGIEIPDRAINDFKTAGDVAAFIENNERG